MRLFPFLLLLAIGLVWFAGRSPAPASGQPVEIGTVKWGRDLDRALEDSKTSGKPVLLLFQEVPGCSGCRKFGKEVLSHSQLVEAIETEFEPVVVFNNQPGKDAEILKQFGEPAWNYQVIRFLDAKGADILPRKDGVWTIEAVAARMVEALEKAGKEVPRYLRALSGVETAGAVSDAAFAMHCFWTGERKFGSLPGVLTTEAGWLEGREVTLVRFDRSVLSFPDLLAHAVSFDCARKVYASTEEDRLRAEESRIAAGTLDRSYRRARESDQKRQLQGLGYENLNLSPIQATKLKAFARTDPEAARSWLSPRQREFQTR